MARREKCIEKGVQEAHSWREGDVKEARERIVGRGRDNNNRRSCITSYKRQSVEFASFYFVASGRRACTRKARKNRPARGTSFKRPLVITLPQAFKTTF